MDLIYPEFIINDLVTIIKNKNIFWNMIFNTKKKFRKINNLNFLQKLILHTYHHPEILIFIKKHISFFINELNFKNDSGYDALMMSIIFCNSYTNPETIEFLIEISVFIDNNTLLLAFKHINDENIKIIKLMIEKVIDINVFDNEQNNILLTACNNSKNDSKYEIIKYLLYLKFDLNYFNIYKENALILICNYDNPKIIKLFLKYDLNINIKSGTQTTPLIKACRNLNNKSIEILIKNGADVNLEDMYGYTPLMGYCSNIKKYSNIEMIDLLLKHTDDINSEICETNALFIICEHLDNPRAKKYAKRMIEMGADVNSMNDDGDSVLAKCCNYSNPKFNIELIKLLLEKGAYVNVPGWRRYDALSNCCYNRNYEAAEILLNNGSNPNALYDKETDCPLYIANSKNDIDMIELLLSYGAYLDKNTFLNASKYTNDVFSYFLEYYSFKIHKHINEILINLCKNNIRCNMKSIKLMMDYGVDINHNNCEALYHFCICTKNKIDILKILKPKILPSFAFDKKFKDSCDKQYKRILYH